MIFYVNLSLGLIALLVVMRTMNGSLAVAAVGAVLTARLATTLPERLGRSAAAIDPERLLHSDVPVPAALAAETRAALASSLDSAFLLVLGLSAVALALGLSAVALASRSCFRSGRCGAAGLWSSQPPPASRDEATTPTRRAWNGKAAGRAR